MYLDLHITKRCNLKCKHCYLSDEEKVNGSDINYETLVNIIDDYLSMKHPSQTGRKIVISGGEPTLHQELEKILRYINKVHNGRLVIPSNGFGVKRLLKTGAVSDNNRIQISIDGNRKIHDAIRGKGSFDTAINALEELVRRNKKTHIFFTINRYNEHTLPEVNEIAADLGVKVFLNYYHNVDETKDNLGMISKQKFIEYLNDNHSERKCYLENCVAGIAGCTVMPDGKYYDCSRNMRYLGEYPQKLKEVLLMDRAKNYNYKNPADTCMKRLAGSFDFGCLERW